MALGDLQRSRQYLLEALELARTAGDLRGLAQETRLLGHIAFLEGDARRAAACFEESLSWWEQLQTTRGLHTTLCEYGHILFALGTYAEAQRRFRESLTLSHRAGDRMATVRCFDGLAATAVILDPGLETATLTARLLGAAAALRVALGLAIRPFDRATHERAKSTTRGALSDDAFEAARTDGSEMSLDQAVEYALALPDGAPGAFER
jgi:non-specific serine/threonine protein kinase